MGSFKSVFIVTRYDLRCWIAENWNPLTEKCPDNPTEGKMLSYVRGFVRDSGKKQNNGDLILVENTLANNYLIK